MVGVTREGSKTFGLYLDPGGEARFHFASGKRQSATWKRRSKAVICFTGLNADKPTEEACKYAPSLGRGLDWISVEIIGEEDNVVNIRRVAADEEIGSSQIVYSFAGETEVSQSSYLPNVGDWPGQVVIGRTFKDKEPWQVRLSRDGHFDMAYASGVRKGGTYRIADGQICLTLDGDDEPDCRRPEVKDGKIRWASAKDGSAISEIVFMYQAEGDGPQKLAMALEGSMPRVAPDGETGLLLGDKGLRFYDLVAGGLIGELPVDYEVRDIALDRASGRVAIVGRQSIEIVDPADGNVTEGFALPDGALLFDAALLSDNRVIVAEGQGRVVIRSLGDGAEQALLADHGVPVNVIALSPDGRFLLAGGERGLLSLIDLAAQPPASQPVEGMSDTVWHVGFTPDGTRLWAAAGNGEIMMAPLVDGKPGAPLRWQVPAAGAISVDIHPTEQEMLIAAGDKLWRRGFDGAEIAGPLDLAGAGVRSVAYARDGKAVLAVTSEGTGLWSRDLASAPALAAETAAISAQKSASELVAQLGENPTLELVNQSRRGVDFIARQSSFGARQSLLAAAASGAAGFYDSGMCEKYDAMRAQLRPTGWRPDCAAHAETVRLRAEYDGAIEALDCDLARARAQTLGLEMAPVESCVTRAREEADRKAFAAAQEAGDCATLHEMEAAQGAPGAGADCDVASVLAGESVRAMFLMGVRLDTSGDEARARRIYEDIMTRFPEDDVAIDAANRLTQMADKAAQEKANAQNAAALKAAQDQAAAAERAANEARAEAEARAAEERRARDAAEARAAEAAAQAAEAQAQAQAAASRSTVCDHVYVGKTFQAKGGFLGLTNFYKVFGVSPESELVTIGKQYSDDGWRQQISCSSVPY